MKLERDRQTVDAFDLNSITRDMWFATEEWDRIASMIEAEAPDLEYAEYSSPQLVKEACYRLFTAKHPGAVVAANQEQLKKLVEQGMTKVVVVGGNMYSNVRSSGTYLNRPSVRVKSPTERLEDWFAKSKFHMRHDVQKTFRALVTESKSWTVQ